MALLNRLFPNKRKSQKQGYGSFGKNEPVSWKPFSFSKEQVRVLLFRECDARGRKVLFDSTAVQKTPLETQHCNKFKFGFKSKCDTNKKSEPHIQICNGFMYQYMKQNPDVTMMDEMIFGSVAMTFRGSALKVHSMKSPDRLVCSKIFHAPVPTCHSKRISDNSLEDSYGSSINSMGETADSKPDLSSIPLDVPLSKLQGKLPNSSMEGDSGFCGDASLRSISSTGSGGPWGSFVASLDSHNGSGSVLSPTGCQSGGSLASLQRRWLRNVSTSLELGINSSWWPGKERNSSGTLGREDVTSHGYSKTRLGLMLVISLTPNEENDMQQFFFEHMAVIEGMVERLRRSVERAYIRKDIFMHLMMEGCQDIQQWLWDLFSAPRLPCPVWMGLVSTAGQHPTLASNFLRDLCQLIAAIDTKATNFFVSTLVTAVLTHHLGWVATVLPVKSPPHNISKQSCSTEMLTALAKSHPYNALWAQLGDLYGALGQPMKVARTIVTANGKKTDLLNKLLSSLSYFIRCGDIEKRIGNRVPIEEETEMLNSILEELMSSSMKSSTASTTTMVPERMTESQGLKGIEKLADEHVKFLSKRRNNADLSDRVYEQQPLQADILEGEGVNQMAQQVLMPSGIGGDSRNVEHERNNIGMICITPEASSRVTSGPEYRSSISSETLFEIHVPPAQSEGNIIQKVRRDNVKSNSCSERLHLAVDSCKCLSAGVECYRTDPSDKCNFSSANLASAPRTLGGMKRSTSFMAKLSSVSTTCEADCAVPDTLETPRLYPNIADLMLMKDELCDESFLHPEVISKKVNRLCRVPTTAVLYHMPVEHTTRVKSIEEFLPKRVENERQLSSADVCRKNRFNVASFSEVAKSPAVTEGNVTFDDPGNSDIVNNNCLGNVPGPVDSVIFVLGDNEELVGLKSPCKQNVTASTVHSSSSCIDFNSKTGATSTEMERLPRNSDVCYPSLDVFTSSDDSVAKHYSSSNESVIHSKSIPQTLIVNNCVEGCQLDTELTLNNVCVCSDLNTENGLRTSESCGSVFYSNEGPGLDSGIVLEEQLGDIVSERHKESTSSNEDIPGAKSKIVTAHSSVIELEDECGRMKVEIIDPIPKIFKPVVRSQSLSFPSQKSLSKKKSNICRRHSEYIHENERYLKDYHSVRFNFERCERVLVDYVEGTDVEKSPQPDKKSLKMNEARGNFELQDSGVKSCYEGCQVSDSDAMLGRDLCGNCDSCSEDDLNCTCSIKKRCSCSELGAMQLQTDQSREGNALFDDYGMLSDEEVLASKDNFGEETEVKGEVMQEENVEESRTIIELPLPRCVVAKSGERGPGLASSLLGGVSDHYVADLVLQGCTQGVQSWETSLRRDLTLATHHPLLDQEVSEAVCIVANADLWEVQLVSSHTSVMDKPGTFGVRVGMSQLVANMLESLLHLWRLRTPPDQCLLHLESKLREVCLRSQSLAELLLTTDFCDMATLTMTLGLEANDVPLLLAVASTHTPQVTRHYGLSFR